MNDPKPHSYSVYYTQTPKLLFLNMPTVPLSPLQSPSLSLSLSDLSLEARLQEKVCILMRSSPDLLATRLRVKGKQTA